MKLVLVGAMLGLMFSLPVAAKTKIIQYETEWMIGGPVADDETDEDTNAGMSRIVRSGEAILESHLRPTSAATVVSDIFDKDGEILAAEGAELFGIKVDHGQAYCVLATGKNNRSNAYNCFFDTDSDGAFDGYRSLGSSYFDTPIFRGKVGKKLKPISDGAFQVMDPADMETDFTVSLIHGGGSKLTGTIDFRIVYGSKARGKSDFLTRPITAKVGGGARPVSVLGGAFLVLAGDKTYADVAVIKPFDRRPFEVRLRTF